MSDTPGRTRRPRKPRRQDSERQESETGSDWRPQPLGSGENGSSAPHLAEARYGIGAVVKHRIYPFRGVVFDIDPTFSNTEEWWESIPAEVRPRKDQPFYHLLAENAETEYVAYVSEQNLLPDTSSEPLRHPQIDEIFAKLPDGSFKAKAINLN